MSFLAGLVVGLVAAVTLIVIILIAWGYIATKLTDD